jgi:hypothetical protein
VNRIDGSRCGKDTVARRLSGAVGWLPVVPASLLQSKVRPGGCRSGRKKISRRCRGLMNVLFTMDTNDFDVGLAIS